MRVSELAFLLR